MATKLIESLNQKVCKNTENSLIYFVENEDSILNFIRNLNGNKTDIQFSTTRETFQLFKICFIFSDFVSIISGIGNIAQILIPHNKEIKLTLPPGTEVLVKEGLPQIAYGYHLQCDEEIKLFINAIEPVLRTERIIIRPARIIMILSNLQTTDGNRIWNTYYANMNTPSSQWILMNQSKDLNSLQLFMKEENPRTMQMLFELTIPFLDGIPSADLIRIAEDEHDHIAKYRLAIKNLIVVAKSGSSDIQQIISDTINPELSNISRRFKKIVQMQSLKIGGAAVSTAALAFMAYSQQGLVQALSAIFSANGLSKLTEEIANLTQENSLIKENPYYFLWKLRKKKKQV